MSCDAKLQLRFPGPWTGVTAPTYTADALIVAEGEGGEKTLRLENVAVFSSTSYFDRTDDLRYGKKDALEGKLLKTNEKLVCNSYQENQLEGLYTLSGDTFKAAK